VNDDDEETKINIHALSGIRTHGLSLLAVKIHASDSAATGTGISSMKTRETLVCT
jgi:hypothetical protein